MNLNNYRLYFLTSDDQIFRFVELSCETDNEAMAEAAKLVDGHAMEIWHRGHRVARFHPAAVSSTDDGWIL